MNYEGETPLHLAVRLHKNIDILKIFESVKHKALSFKDIRGENTLFHAVRAGSAEIYNWFYDSRNMEDDSSLSMIGPTGFFKARGEQNYKGQTIEHIVCKTRANMEIVEAIKPRPDIKDYYGNLPLFYAIERNDTELVQRLFKKGRDYFNLRNYKNESIFHIAARKNARNSLEILVDGRHFTEELLKKDYSGNTPLHYAAKKGHSQLLEFFMEEQTKLLLDIQNDFGLTVREVIVEKVRYLDDLMRSLEDRALVRANEDLIVKL
jgi:ankyrin repeat protein